VNIISNYFNWLQKDTPSEVVEKYPEINNKGETSVKGIFITGDLTGIPLLKFASESGKEIIDQFSENIEFLKQKNANRDDNIYDIIIVGAGPAGISAGIEASKKNFHYTILESTQKFNTIENFPKGKPIIAESENLIQDSELKIIDGTKESLLEELSNQIEGKDLRLIEQVVVKRIEKKDKHFELTTTKGKYKTLRIILAIGKSGNARALNVPGEYLDKVYNRLYDPADVKGLDVLIVGGGDSALEAAIETAEYAKSVAVSYRKKSFARPKEDNVEKIVKLTEEGKLKLLMNTNVKTIKNESVILTDKEDREIEMNNSIVYIMIGRELPIAFFKRSKIRMEGELSLIAKLQFLLLILVSGVIYFGKSSRGFYEYFFGGKADSFDEAFSQLFTGDFWYKFVNFPTFIFENLSPEKFWDLAGYFLPVISLIAYLSFIGTVILGGYLLFNFLKNNSKSFSFDWSTFKYTYFIFLAVFFVVVFFGGKYFGVYVLGKSQSFWYTGLYSLTILIFGLRRMKVKPTKYIKLQTWTLVLIQAFPLFILPEFVFPFLGKIGALGGENGFIMTQVFPHNSYWRSYGFILAWPLNIGNLFNGNITTFWLFLGIAQTFILIPFLAYKWGKGAYCGWICSCGALAETLGDEYRTKAPHGMKAKKWENLGQWILAFAFLITALKLISILFNLDIPVLNENISYTADYLKRFYGLGIDIVFAGVLGVGVYFFMSGRIWCRYGCPLAALMHIYTRFSRYRIFSEKKSCISCNICTKVCHMGIDVMNYANKGIPMNDVECVRCSACIVNCPTKVLTFGFLLKSDVNNESYRRIILPVLDKNDWRSGLG